MEFLKQDKQNQRHVEYFINFIYSIYTINLCISMLRRKEETWIAVVMMAMMFVCWAVCLGRYRNFRIRAAVTSVIIQLTVVLYAANVDDLSAVVPPFIVLAVLVALYGFSDFLWLTIAALAFIAFYHGVVLDTYRLASREDLLYVLAQLGDILCVEFVLYVWLKNRNESAERMSTMIEALMDAEQSKDDFLSNVSHEIRTPVNTICGMSEMALREYDLQKIREEIFDIRDAGHNLMSLVSDILDFSQLQQGKMNLEEEVYNITSTVNDIINMAMAKRGDKPIELVVDCSADIPSELLGDEKKIRRVIMNLVDNAIKYTSEGGVIISVSTRKEDYGVNLCVTVRDTGIGIKEDSLERLFESFSQVDTRRNRQKGGVGLGLAISKELIQKMGGTVTVQSCPGKGSIFRFVVPQKVLNEKPIGQVKDREKFSIAAYFDMEQFDMMAIRDEYSKLIIHMVQQLGVKCHVCRNLAELKRRHGQQAFTHVFISLEEYQEDAAYFDDMAKNSEVILVIERYNEKHLSNPSLVRLYKPFYILPVVSILNGSKGSEGGRRMLRQGKFIAPDVHVLVVDDNRMNIRVVEGLLKEYQIKVTYATSGREALELIENMCYDFVFMDHMMPEMDGIETLHHIREKSGHYYRQIPVIALTANATPGNREMFLEEGFDDFVAKPLEVSVLERVLKRNLPEEKLIYLTREDGTAGDAVPPADEGETVSVDNADYKEEDNVPDNNTYALSGSDDEFAVGDLDVSQGMLYCGGKQQYLEILQECLEEREESLQRMESLHEKQDWKNYTINVHAIKSTMKSIGAMPLSEKAKALEMAGKNGDIGFILKNHEDMMEEYRRVMEELVQCPLLHVPETEDIQDTESDTRTVSGGQPAHGQEYDSLLLPELSEENFDQLLAELEDAMYSLDGEHMLAVLSKMQEYQYCGIPLREKLVPVKKKIEKSDFMSAVDAVSKIREGLKSEKEGGAAQ